FPQGQAIHARASAPQAAAGRRRDVGRRLGRLLRDAGYADVTQDVFAYDSDTVGIEPFGAQLSADRLLPQLDDGVDIADFALVRAVTERFMTAPRAYVLFVG